ncbi:MAG: universal stress protein [bacterium]
MNQIQPDVSRILVYLDLTEDVEYDCLPLELFSSLTVVLLGIYPVSDQATPEQTRDNFGDEAERIMDEVESRFFEQDVDTERCIKFTSDPVETLNSVALEQECDAILTPGEFESLERILVPVKGTEQFERMAGFIDDLLAKSPQNVTLVGFVEEKETTSDRRSYLEQFQNELTSGEMREEMIEIRVDTVEDVESMLIEEIEQYDLAVLGESEPELVDVVVGSVHENVINETTVPIITVIFPGEEGRQHQIREDD